MHRRPRALPIATVREHNHRCAHCGVVVWFGCRAAHDPRYAVLCDTCTVSGPPPAIGRMLDRRAA